MYSRIKLLYKYLDYYLTAQNGKGHGIHSPFVFDFVINVLNDKGNYYAYEQVEDMRQELLKDKHIIEVEDLGAGSVVAKTRQRRVCDIARHAAKPEKYGQLLFRMVNHYRPSTIIELGTSLGITTAYLAAADTSIPVMTLEGASSVAEEAVNNFAALGLPNIRLIEGNFDDTLPKVIDINYTTGLVFIDGNHRKEPTIRYFYQLLEKADADSILIFDDIHWSKEMEDAWGIIKAHSAVTATIDLFFIGIVFFRTEFKEKQHFVVRY
ncbi:MAG TPA: class I SAM-dependent methyltransferase [Chitinophagaceae bacterium]|nr:class I SAM-dependent methyltransferase [Chitinophagaceae bacterium]